MTDFEDRLSLALRSAGGRAPDAAGLAPAARRRAGVRRRRTALTSVAAVLAVAGVVGGVAVLDGLDPESRSVAGDPSPTASGSTQQAPRSARLESWRDISVSVPSQWGYGNLSTHCLQDERYVVDRGLAARAVKCGPYDFGYGVQFRDGSTINLVYPPGHIWQYGWESAEQVKMYPEDSWLGYQASGDNLVWVVAENRETVEQVLGSFVRNGDVDPVGCATRMGGEQGERTLPAEGQLRLCRYALDGWLEQSELLTGQDAADAEAALGSAPLKDDRMCTMALEGPTVVVATSDAEGQVTLDACQGFSWAGKDHDLTEDVLYWALSPGWSGGVEGDVPMPTRLRQ